MTIPSEVVAAFLLMMGTIIGALIAAVGVSRKIGRVHSEVTMSNGDSALVRAIRAELITAMADHERRLH